MHREFLTQLKGAEGESKLVIGINVDVRGFSRFSLEVDSVETALFVKKIYARIVEQYFVDADFFKPTGDGLLLVFIISEETLEQKANELVQKSLALVRGFPGLLRDEPIVNFPVPDKVGIGLARGAACRLASGELTLDYSGTVLNLASRLMELARPSGVVIDGHFGVSLLTRRLRKQFASEDVYLRSLAEKLPRQIWYSSALTQIAPSYKRPVDEVRWQKLERRYPISELTIMGNRFYIRLPSIPLDPAQISVAALHPKILPGGKKHPRNRTYGDVVWRYETDADEAGITFAFADFAQRLAARGARRNWQLHLIIKYPER